MQYIIKAYDGENMLERRLAVRPRHLENMAKVPGKVICAGGLLDEEDLSRVRKMFSVLRQGRLFKMDIRIPVHKRTGLGDCRGRAHERRHRER